MMISDLLMEKRPGDKGAWVPDPDEKMDVPGSLPFIGVHVAALAGVFLVGFSWIAVAMCVAMYVVRMFAITAGYHRYFSHMSYKTSRWFQFVLAWVATSSTQMGPLWWASHHRYHHMYSDTEQDVHSPIMRTVYWAHCGWILCKKYMQTINRLVKDLSRYPELVWLNTWHVVPGICLALTMYGLGKGLAVWAPGLGTNGAQMLIWGFFVSTVFLYHGTFTINSFCHLMGTRRYNTADSSRNSLFLAIITLGEGWHNNHHRFPASERQGFFWYELDITHYILVVLSWFGIVWGLKGPSEEVLAEAKFFDELKKTLNPDDLHSMGIADVKAPKTESPA
jgi:stearoyl-CoA desaturase (delta-9 desaturase)